MVVFEVKFIQKRIQITIAEMRYMELTTRAKLGILPTDDDAKVRQRIAERVEFLYTRWRAQKPTRHPKTGENTAGIYGDWRELMRRHVRLN